MSFLGTIAFLCLSFSLNLFAEHAAPNIQQPTNHEVVTGIGRFIDELDSDRGPARERAQSLLTAMLRNPLQHMAVLSAINLRLQRETSLEQRRRLELLQRLAVVDWSSVMQSMRTGAQNSPLIARTRNVAAMLQQALLSDGEFVQLAVNHAQKMINVALSVKSLRMKQNELTDKTSPEWRAIDQEIARLVAAAEEQSVELYNRVEARHVAVLRAAGATVQPGFNFSRGTGTGTVLIGNAYYSIAIGLNQVTATPVVMRPNRTFVPENVVMPRADFLSDVQVAGLGHEPANFTPSLTFPMGGVTAEHMIDADTRTVTPTGSQTRWATGFHALAGRQLSEHFNAQRAAITSASSRLTRKGDDDATIP